jgi:phage-related protein
MSLNLTDFAVQDFAKTQCRMCQIFQRKIMLSADAKMYQTSNAKKQIIKVLTSQLATELSLSFDGKCTDLKKILNTHQVGNMMRICILYKYTINNTERKNACFQLT